MRGLRAAPRTPRRTRRYWPRRSRRSRSQLNLRVLRVLRGELRRTFRGDLFSDSEDREGVGDQLSAPAASRGRCSELRGDDEQAIRLAVERQCLAASLRRNGLLDLEGRGILLLDHRQRAV